GRVLMAGSGHNYSNNYENPTAEIYSPAYLFRGARPTITSSPGTVTYGSSFFVGTLDAPGITSVALVRTGSVTHDVSMDQRYIPLPFTQPPGGLAVQAPADANLAPSGDYMLFIINANGVPSIAPFIRLPAPYEDVTPPSAPANLAASGGIGTATLTWTAS